MGHSWPLFFIFFISVDSKQIYFLHKSLPMTGFEQRTSAVGSDHSTNWATTTAHQNIFLLHFRLFNAVDSKQIHDKSLLVPGFEPLISGVGGDHSTNWTTPLPNTPKYLFVGFCSRRNLSVVQNWISKDFPPHLTSPPSKQFEIRKQLLHSSKVPQNFSSLILRC